MLVILRAAMVLALCGALCPSALAQAEGMISGLVVAVQGEEGRDTRVVVVSDGQVTPVGTVRDAGEVFVDYDSRIGLGTEVQVVVVRNGSTEVVLVEPGQRYGECDDERIADRNDDDCVLVGVIIWGRTPTVAVRVRPDRPSLTQNVPRTMRPSTGGHRVGVGVKGGYNTEFEELFFGGIARVRLADIVPVPLVIAMEVEFYPGDDYVSILAPSAELLYEFGLGAGAVSAFAGAGVHMYRQSFSFGPETVSHTETGFGLRGGVSYGFGKRFVGLVDASVVRAYGSTLPALTVGVLTGL